MGRGHSHLLDPRQPQRWGLLRAVADELHARSEEGPRISPRAILARVSWRLHLSPRTGICYLQSILTRPPLVWPCAREGWGNRLGEGASPTVLDVRHTRHALPTLTFRDES